MKKTYSLSLHVFRRDLRLQDNTALIAALDASEQVIPCFIFDKRQIEHNNYKSEHCLQFMMQSLQELDAELQKKQSRLYFFYGIAEEVVARLLQTLPIQAVFFNRDYTPFSLERDRHIEKWCRAQDRDFHCYGDALLQEPEDVHKPNGESYTIFTHYYKKALLLPVNVPQKNKHAHYYQKPIDFAEQNMPPQFLQRTTPNLAVKGGRREGIELLKQTASLVDYANRRNFPAMDATTKLSAHNKFGTISIREFYAFIKQLPRDENTLIKELYWRDFFTYITFHYPRVLGEAFHAKYNHIAWSTNMNHFRLWCEGRTGFPIIDAGMRELNTTGYMHNRVRMITASFLTKDLHIDWRWGEKYFAQQLVDYDPAVNNGNWQWSASTGCDAQPYFRIFNPWLQQKKFDPDCLYIKRWIPELARVPLNIIHEWYKPHPSVFSNYPSPMLDHTRESAKTKALYTASI